MVANIKTRKAKPITVNESLTAGSECRTAVVGKPVRYAARKIPTNIIPTPSRTNRNFVIRKSDLCKQVSPSKYNSKRMDI